MKGIGSLLRPLLPFMAVAAVTMAIAAPAAQAGVEHYCEGANLSAQWVCAGSPHCCSLYSDIQTNHTGCAAFATGYGGYSGSSTDYNHTFNVACTSGSGTNGGSYTVEAPVHGAIKNPNQSTADFISEAHTSYDAF